MPFIRNTTRRISQHVITLNQLTRANWQVIDEMDDLGFWHPRLDDIDVYLVPVAFDSYGWFLPDGHIHVPAVTGAGLWDLIAGRHTRLTDVLRHEWAHALADRRPKLVENRRFHSVFGGAYYSQNQIWDYDPDFHLTPYAAAMPCEDFAETFHYYLRHKGRMPKRLQNKPEIIRKWEFIDWMAGQSNRY